ncbi:uncharacterized protein LOC131606062 [Vicia villosa]|uniref:uncharacterized protein LOC131606062 n=1 Tax=Vicia villosa TaxID=3911 RepID=UPI00273B006C|nr:uncharacterized protein LOC131606062 [Vicia villosa]
MISIRRGSEEEGRKRHRDGDNRDKDMVKRHRDGDDNGRHKELSDYAKRIRIDRDEKESRCDLEREESRKKEDTGIPQTGINGVGVYIPPFKLAMMMKQQVDDKTSPEYQRLTWDALRKSINGLLNKVNATNIKNIIPELFSESLIRGRGLFCRSCIKSQMAYPGFTDVFSALVAVVNTKFSQIGGLLLRRIVLQLKRAYKRNDKPQLLAAVKFLAHLVNQQVAHHIIALELLIVLLENPTDDSVEVAVGFVTECGSILQDLSPTGLHGNYMIIHF